MGGGDFLKRIIMSEEPRLIKLIYYIMATIVGICLGFMVGG